MKKSVFLCMAGVVAAAIALGASASPALGAAHTLNLSGPSTAVVGQPVLFQVSGTAAPPSEFWDLSWIQVVAIPESVMSACPADGHSAGQVAEGGGGAILTIAMRPNKDAAGNFTNQVGATPRAPGGVLICAYTENEEGLTLSRASLILRIQPATSTRGGTRPASIPDEVASGIRGCRALLSRPRGCIRRVVRGANASCRRQDSPRSRTRCLRAVRRVARRHA